MVQRSVTLKAIRFIAKDLVFDFLYWPIWWYSSGLSGRLNQFANLVLEANQQVALTVWIKNIFNPMFGDYSWQGRIISFFMRVVQIIGRLVLFFLIILINFILLLAWMAVPLFVIYQILFNLKLIPGSYGA